MVFAILVWNRVWFLPFWSERSEKGYRFSGSGLKRGMKNHILVWNRVRVLRTVRHTPTQNVGEYPPGMAVDTTSATWKTHEETNDEGRIQRNIRKELGTYCTRLAKFPLPLSVSRHSPSEGTQQTDRHLWRHLSAGQSPGRRESPGCVDQQGPPNSVGHTWWRHRPGGAPGGGTLLAFGRRAVPKNHVNTAW